MKQRSGYTLIEVSIALAALLIFTALCSQFVWRSRRAAVSDTLALLQIELQCLQQQAMSCNESSSIKFIPAENKYVIIQAEKETVHSLPKNVIFGFLPHVKGPPGRPTQLISQAIRFENPRPLAAIIQPHGRISSGTVYVKHTSSNDMGAVTITPHQVAHVRSYLFEDGSGWQLVAA
jgi:prepilin-type N-terminal cleavage/methylation domain-containing protein